MYWSQIGKYKETKLLAGTLPRHGISYITGAHTPGKTAIIADLVVALAAGDLGCGLGLDSSGTRQSLSGWFGNAVGSPSRIAVACPLEELDATRAAIEACALARGVTGPLPIVIWGQHGDFVATLRDGTVRWHEARDELGVLDLIVVAGASFGEPHEHRKLVLALHSMVSATKSPILVSVDTLPADQADLAQAILDTSSDGAGGVLTLAKPPAGAGWSRRHELARVRLGTVEAVVASAGRTVAFAPHWHEAPPPPPPAPKAESPIVARLVYPMTGYEISAEEKARWPDHGWIFTLDQAVAAVEGARALAARRLSSRSAPWADSPAPKSTGSRQSFSPPASWNLRPSSPPSKGYCPPREASAHQNSKTINS